MSDADRGDAVQVGTETGEEGARLAQAVVDAGGGHVQAIVLFGSRLVDTTPGAHSAWDFVVVVDGYRPFYRAYVASAGHRRSAGLLSALARVLAPNIVAFMPELPGEPTAKCMILTSRDFERALGPDAKDHFVKGRMVQHVAVVHARDRKIEGWIERVLGDARRQVIDWVAPYLDEPFDAASFARRMLRVSYSGEVRPESKDRVLEVFEAQRDALEEMYETALGALEVEGRVVRVRQDEGPADAEGTDEPRRYRLAAPLGRLERIRLSAYWLRSKARATARWFKHVLTFDDWLTYIQRKVERRTGRAVELTARERKYPLIFLWPKVFRVLRSLPARRDDEGEATA